jgi:hypothetical protein
VLEVNGSTYNHIQIAIAIAATQKMNLNTKDFKPLKRRDDAGGGAPERVVVEAPAWTRPRRWTKGGLDGANRRARGHRALATGEGRGGHQASGARTICH